MSISWIWFLTLFIIKSLNLIGVIFNVPTTFLAITILSFGNSLPDLTLNSALADSGYGEMALSGSIAGPLFNLLIGFGFSLIKKNITDGPIKLHIFKFKHSVIVITCSILLFNLIRLLIQAWCLGFKLTKSVGIVGYTLYILFLIGICLDTFYFNLK